MQRAVGLATLPVDGFVSLRAGVEVGTLTMKTIGLPGGALFVNAEVKGSLRVEIRDADGHPLPGFSLGDCLPILSGGRSQAIRWVPGPGLDTLRGKAAKIHFELRQGDLYAFWFDSNTDR